MLMCEGNSYLLLRQSKQVRYLWECVHLPIIFSLNHRGLLSDMTFCHDILTLEQRTAKLIYAFFVETY